MSLYGLKFLVVVPTDSFKYKSVVGLRGFLAFFVFLYHSFLWYGYLKEGKWGSQHTNINALGDYGISFFFMTTGFLFFNKLLEKKGGSIDWGIFFKARLFRLAPMYFLVVTLLTLIVFAAGGFTLYSSFGRDVDDLWKWYSFTLLGTPDINRFKDTYLVISGVQWALIYEWIFYLFLPFAAFLFYRIKTPKALLFICAAIIVVISIKNEPKLVFLLAFLSGLLTSFLNKNEKFVKIARHPLSSFAVLGCMLAIVIFMHKFNVIPFTLATVMFCLIACENSFFGTLHTRIAGILGQISYSVYLIHGIIIYVTMNFIIGLEKAKSLSITKYCMVIVACILPLFIISSITYNLVEARFIAKGHQRKKK
jgi:peptidoglycan/LPS O-acetylase OafA/YrhL